MDEVLKYAAWLCTICLGISAFFDHWAALSNRSIFEGRLKTNFLGKTGFKVSWFIFFTVASIWLSNKTSQQSEDKARKELTQKEIAHQKHDDSLQLVYKKDIQNTNDSNIQTFSKSLLEFNLSYNKEQKKVQSLIRDSNIHELPGLAFVNPQKNESYNPLTRTDSIHLEYHNTGNCTIFVNYRIYTAGWFSNNRLFCTDLNEGMKNRQLPQSAMDTVNVSVTSAVRPDKNIYLILGWYTNTKGTIRIPIDELWVYDNQTNQGGTPFDPNYKDSLENEIKIRLHIKGAKRR